MGTLGTRMAATTSCESISGGQPARPWTGDRNPVALQTGLQEIAAILATGILRLSGKQSGLSSAASEIPDNSLDLCPGKSVHCDEPAEPGTAGQSRKRNA